MWGLGITVQSSFGREKHAHACILLFLPKENCPAIHLHILVYIYIYIYIYTATNFLLSPIMITIGFLYLSQVNADDICRCMIFLI
jgi:hypothetical protein